MRLLFTPHNVIFITVYVELKKNLQAYFHSRLVTWVEKLDKSRVYVLGMGFRLSRHQ